MDLSESLTWCIENEVDFTLTYQAGFFVIKAARQNIFAEYAIDQPVGPEAVGTAFLNAVHAVEHGTKFHQQHGDFPPIDPTLPAGPSE